MKFSFYVSGNASRLKKLLDKNSNILTDVKLVFSDDGATQYLEPLLLERGIQYELYDYRKIDKNNDRNLKISNKLLELLQSYDIDYCYCFGMHILEGELLKKYENRIINFHPSILPLFPGVDAIDQALEANMEILGNTAHFIDQGMDTGPIIMQNIISAKVFEEKGYAGVLDQQLIMIRQIHEWLKQGKVRMNNENVLVEGNDYLQGAFFPATR